MNKSFCSVVLIAFLGLSTFSCTKDIIDIPEVPEKPVVPPTPTEVLLGINPSIAGMEAVTRGIITNFTDNDKIGLFITEGELGDNYQGNTDAANVPASYFQGAWKVEKKIPVTAQGVVYAYYPHNNKVTDGAAVPVEIASQTDYLYARSATVDAKNPIADIGMRHALSLVSVRVRKNDYQHEGKLAKIEVLDVLQSGTMNIATGKVTGGSTSTYSVEPNLLLDDNDLEKTQMIMLPVVVGEAQGNMRFQITIDAKYYTWDIPKSHIWEAGKEYTYTLNLGKTPEETPDLELDVDYWTKYGKDDNIQIEDHTQPGSAYYRVADVEVVSTPYGRTVIQGESYIFSGVVTSRAASFKGRVKYTLWQGNKMVEQFPSYYFECEGKNYYTTLFIPCFITAAPGTYRLKILLKEEGKNTWFIPSDRYSEEQDWNFTVQGAFPIPSLKSMNVEGFRAAGDEIQQAKLNQPFNMEYTLTNRAGVALKGEIKAVWHRAFTGEFNVKSNDDGQIWEDEIGHINIDLSADIRECKGVIPCQIAKERIYPKKYCPQVSLYYKAEGTSTWLLMRSDSDSELQRWKGADIDKIVNGSYDSPERYWAIQGGLNYQYIRLEN